MDGNQPNVKKWIILYPVYINSKKTIAEGRRISVDKACANPTCVQITECCSHLKLSHHVEHNKAYPRDFTQRGRVRIKLKNEDGTLCIPAIRSRKELMIKIAELAPNYHGRTTKQESSTTTTSTAESSKGRKGGRRKK